MLARRIFRVIFSAIFRAFFASRIRLKCDFRALHQYTISLERRATTNKGETMYWLILICAVCADPVKPEPIPREFQLYFQRADKAEATMTAAVNKKIADLEEAIRSEPSSKLKEPLRKKLADARKDLAELRRAKVFAYLPGDAAIDDIGVLPRADYVVLDAERAIAATSVGVFILTRTDTKKLKDGALIEETWRVIPPSASIKVALKESKRELAKYHVLEPIKKGDLERFRMQYEQQKKLGPPAEIAQAVTPKFPLDPLALETALADHQLKFSDREGEQQPGIQWRDAKNDNGAVWIRVHNGKVAKVVHILPINKAEGRADARVFATINRSLLAKEDLENAALWLACQIKIRGTEADFVKSLNIENFPVSVVAVEFGPVLISSRCSAAFDILVIAYEPKED
jgi:hypothetical protein